MELEHKLVEDRDAAHAESRQREDLEQRGADQLPDPIIEAVDGAAREQRGQLLGTIRMILDQQQLEIDLLDLPAREIRALAALRIAVTGRDELGEFVYAEDRHDLLERALGVLQPDVTHVDTATARELHAQLVDLSQRVAELRHTLSSLEDAQDEILESHQKEALDAAARKPPPAGDDQAAATAGVDPEERAPAASTLAGPDLPEPAPAPSTLTGPDLPEPASAPSTLTGPDLPEPAPAPSTLTGPEVPERAPAPSTLTGPEVPDAPPVPSTLGDPAEVAEAQARKPWWRRPFG